MKTFLDKHFAIIEANKKGERIRAPQFLEQVVSPVPSLGEIDLKKSPKLKRPKGERQKIIELIAKKKSHGCSICGYNKCKASLDFHHIDPKTKNFAIAKAASFSLDEVILELDKCILVCANCHGEIHAGITNALRAASEQ